MRQIPRAALPDTMSVKVPKDGTYGGEYEEPVTVSHVRFDKAVSLLNRSYVLTDGASGIVYVDAVNSDGAFEIPEASLVSLNGDEEEMTVMKSNEYRTYDSVHHWELEVG